jgi:oligopeptide/dipeptide ABC transporter ATP-binding protein
MGLLPRNSAKVTGSVFYGDQDVLTLRGPQLRRLRGKEIALVFQEPMAALNPLLRIGQHLVETVREHHHGMSKREAMEKSIELLESVRVPEARQRMSAYPHQFSGGMAQRVAIALAIANNPRVLIADEPTTALDVTVQAQVMQTLSEARRATGAAMILVTHDLGLIAEVADRVVVMYGGRVVESGPVTTIFDNPRHPYTVGLLGSIPRLDQSVDRLATIPGQPPDSLRLAAGCAFEARCRIGHGRDVCGAQVPALADVGPDHVSACHFAHEVTWHNGSRQAPAND